MARRASIVRCPSCGDAIIGYVEGDPCGNCGTGIDE
jgi:ribosomal protein S27E